MSPLFAINHKMYALSGNSAADHRLILSVDGGRTWQPADAGVGLEFGNWIYDFDVAPLTIGAGPHRPFPFRSARRLTGW